MPASELPLIVPISNATSWYSHAFWCPACKTGHVINLEPARGEPLWTLSGTPEAPTVRASVLVKSGNADGPTVCHLFITDGQIQYLSDCTHQLAGQTVSMEHFFNPPPPPVGTNGTAP
jgi:Family of unknown function (DUF6527)